MAQRQNLPLLAFVNKMDRPGADFHRVCGSLKTVAGLPAVPVELPLGEGKDFEGVVDLIDFNVRRFEPSDQGKTIHTHAVPPPLLEQAKHERARLCEAVVETDDTLLETWLEDPFLEASLLRQALRSATIELKLVPVFCGSAFKNMGVQPLLDGVVDFLPHPLESRAMVAQAKGSGGEVLVQPDSQLPCTAFVFKLFHEDHATLCYIRVYSGTLRLGESLTNVRTGEKGRPLQLFRMHAGQREPLESAGPGDLIVLTGMKHVATGDTLCGGEELHALEAMSFTSPVIRQTIEPAVVGDQDKLHRALETLTLEDPTLELRVDPDSGQTLLAGLGELHLEVARHRLERDHRVKVRVGRPSVALRESISQECRGQGALSRSEGEDRMEVRVQARITPSAEDAVHVVLEGIAAGVGEVLLPNWDQHQNELAQMGGPHGWPLACMTITLHELSLSSEGHDLSAEWFLVAASRAIDDALSDSTQLLEPVMTLSVETPDEFLSGVLADLQGRRAQVEDVQVEEGVGRIRAEVALDEVVTYSTELRSLTQGRAGFSMEPSGHRLLGS
ncbi:MAG: EF-Tu/IF-2/RF-3 family GTPase, partial [Planctomycetes bacterium]|nr:EF-Tu/IF-2/RF-3 family GTPase [Planctomycetota bacterium]